MRNSDPYACPICGGTIEWVARHTHKPNGPQHHCLVRSTVPPWQTAEELDIEYYWWTLHRYMQNMYHGRYLHPDEMQAVFGAADPDDMDTYDRYQYAARSLHDAVAIYGTLEEPKPHARAALDAVIDWMMNPTTLTANPT